MTFAVPAAGVGSGLVLAGIVQIPGLSTLFGCRPLGPLGWTTAAASTAGAIALLGRDTAAGSPTETTS